MSGDIPPGIFYSDDRDLSIPGHDANGNGMFAPPTGSFHAHPESSSKSICSYPDFMIRASSLHFQSSYHRKIRFSGRDMYSRTDQYGQMAAPRTDPFAPPQPYMPGMNTMNHMNMGPHGPGAFFQIYEGPPIKQEHTCLWIEKDQTEPKKPCNKVFSTMHEIVTHLTVEHVGGPGAN